MKITSSNFEMYLSEANAAKTQEELFKVLAKTVARHGLDKAMFVLATDHSDIGEKAGRKLFSNYPDHWMNYYTEKQYEKIDPITLYGIQQSESFTWKEVFERMELNKLQKTCLSEGIESGLNNGICTPVRGPNHSIAGLSLASTEKKDSFDGNTDLITAYTNHFYIAYRRLAKKKLKLANDDPVPNYALTQKERDILSWAAQGKSLTDIAQILTMSGHTVNFHMRNIYKKLEVNRLTLAITKAITFGLIQP